ncbi:MAG TPA: sulfatase-like hydrolase/transferase [Terriglobales bacterium]|jgi:N-acetylglucosamine-6-sulfatase
MPQSCNRIARLGVTTIALAVLFAAPAAQGQQPCEQIKTACTKAGFVPGGASSGSGLWRDCVDPILNGRARSRKSGKPVPQVDPQVVAACKTQDPSFGQPKSANAGVASAPMSAPPASVPATPPPPLSNSAQHPNIVFVLTDDLSMNLLQFMPHVLQMEKDGVTFANYFVTDSLCCPSRSSIFTGNFPHNTGIFKNQGDDGGYLAFVGFGREHSTFATALWSAGYRTAMMGKYLNGYEPARHAAAPGWTTWNVAGNGYPEFHYSLNQNGQVVPYGMKPQDYLTDVMAELGRQYIKQSKGQPFVIEIATFAPHAPYTPAPRDASAFSGLTVPRTPAFDAAPDLAGPRWLSRQPALTAADKMRIDEAFRKRAQSVLAVDAMIGALQAAVAAIGQAQFTYFVFSSDNGYHMGDYRLMPGKMTAFDTDIHVPLVITGPGVAAGRIVDDIVENIDLYPTFLDLTGVASPASVDGHSVAPLLRGQRVADWRTAALVEHHGPRHEPEDPDAPAVRSGNPPTYEAMRTATALYVEYADGDREYHDLAADPFELRNTFTTLTAEQKAALHAAIAAMQACRGSESCWTAQHPKLAGSTKEQP